jgi:hypothetical protein
MLKRFLPLWFVVVICVAAPVRGQNALKGAESDDGRKADAEDAEKRSRSNLKEIGAAFHNYHDVFGHFPASTRDKNDKPLLSWRVEILPYVEAADLYNEFRLDEPWNSAHNRRLVARMPAVFRASGVDEQEKTTYLVPVGPKALFPRDKSDPRKPHEVPRLTINGEPRSLVLGVSLADVRDGASNTILVLEAEPKRAVVWTQPDDFEFDAEKPRAGLEGMFKGGFHSLFVDGSVHLIPLSTEDTVLRSLFDPTDGKAIPVDVLR